MAGIAAQFVSALRFESSDATILFDISNVLMLSMERLCFVVVVARLCRRIRDLRPGRISVTKSNLLINPAVYGVCLPLSVALVFTCAAVAGEPFAAGNAVSDSQPKRNIRATALPSTSVDGQTSWILEPDVPRIPQIAGLKPQLPPHVERQLSYAFDLAQRGATFSANGQFREVLNLCALELDARAGGTSRREALHEAWAALEEADDFNTGRLELWDTAQVRLAAASHRTSVLKDRATRADDSIQAVQAYYAFAEKRFTYACRELPGASLAFYGLARTFVVPGTQVPQAAGKAALLQRVALAIAPQNVLARNELGVLLAEYGQLNEAERQFQECLATSPTPEAWRNLAVVYARKGDRPASQKAMAAADALAAKRGGAHLAESASNQSGDAGRSDKTQPKSTFWDNFRLSNLRNTIWK
jgi:tetratricopeptide (TPR) repeat protein